MDGGLKLSELGSWSPPVALGSDVAISPLLSDLQLGNNSTANKTVQVILYNSHLKYIFLITTIHLIGRPGFYQKIMLSMVRRQGRVTPEGCWAMNQAAQFGENCARRTSNTHIRINVKDNIQLSGSATYKKYIPSHYTL